MRINPDKLVSCRLCGYVTRKSRIPRHMHQKHPSAWHGKKAPRQMSRLWWTLPILAVVFIASMWLAITFPFAPPQAVPSFHWHAHLTLADGSVPPAGIGLLPMQAMHTHAADGVIHMEPINVGDTPGTMTLRRFYSIWGQPLPSGFTRAPSVAFAWLPTGPYSPVGPDEPLRDGDLVRVTP